MYPFTATAALCACLCLLSILVAAQPATSPPVMTAGVSPESPLLPDGYRMVAWLNCGEQTCTDEERKPRIQLLNGAAYAFPGVAGPLGSAAFDADRVVYEISGLSPERDYVLGFSWWDEDAHGRVQSAAFSLDADEETWDTVLPPVRASAFNADKSTWARAHLPFAAPYDRAESLRVAFVSEDGPNAVVNELWLLEREAGPTPRRVLIVTGDDYAGHDWRATAPALAEILREEKQLEVSITESPAIFASPLMIHYDAAVLHFKNYADRLPLGPAIQEGLKRYVESGRGLLLTHFACGAFEEWDGFVDIAGRIWNPALPAHDPHGRFTVRVTDETHPITEGMRDFETIDELYTCLDGDAPITVLCDAVSVVDGRKYPMAFIVENTGGRVFHCVLGHDVVAYQEEGVRYLFQRAIAWALGMDQ